MVDAKDIGRRRGGAQLHESTADHVVLTWNDFIFAVFKHETTLDAVRTIQRVYDELAAKFPKGVYMVTVVESGAPMPATEVRTALADFLAGGAGRTRRSAVIHEGVGFRAAAVRGVVTGLAMVARLPYPHKVFATATEASGWLAIGHEDGVDPNDFIDALLDARASASATPP
jgi:hypothetical protein